MEKISLILILFLSSCFCFVSNGLSAEDSGAASTGVYPLQVPIFNYAQSQNIAEYILKIYEYALIVLVPLTIIVIIISGIMWISAAGDSGKINKAKDRLKSGFIGLGIALFSYIILNLVGITSLNLPGLQTISRLEGDALQMADAPDTVGGDLCAGQTTYASADECKTKEAKCATKACTNGSGNKFCCIDKPAAAVYVHWTAGNTSTNSEHYTFAVSGDGVIHQNYSETEGTHICTWRRNGKGNICVAGMGADNWKLPCYKKSSVRGESCPDTNSIFTQAQITAMVGKINELKTKYKIPALTHSQAAIQDRYHCYLNPDPAVIASRGKFGCKWDWYTHDDTFN